MTSHTFRASARPSMPHISANATMATLIAKIRAYRAARKAALLKKRTDLIVSRLDAHILRDIGLNPELGVKPGRVSFDSRSDIYGY